MSREISQSWSSSASQQEANTAVTIDGVRFTQPLRQQSTPILSYLQLQPQQQQQQQQHQQSALRGNGDSGRRREIATTTTTLQPRSQRPLLQSSSSLMRQGELRMMNRTTTTPSAPSSSSSSSPQQYSAVAQYGNNYSSAALASADNSLPARTSPRVSFQPSSLSASSSSSLPTLHNTTRQIVETSSRILGEMQQQQQQQQPQQHDTTSAFDWQYWLIVSGIIVAVIVIVVIVMRYLRNQQSAIGTPSSSADKTMSSTTSSQESTQSPSTQNRTTEMTAVNPSSSLSPTTTTPPVETWRDDVVATNTAFVRAPPPPPLPMAGKIEDDTVASHSNHSYAQVDEARLKRAKLIDSQIEDAVRYPDFLTSQIVPYVHHFQSMTQIDQSMHIVDAQAHKRMRVTRLTWLRAPEHSAILHVHRRIQAMLDNGDAKQVPATTAAENGQSHDAYFRHVAEALAPTPAQWRDARHFVIMVYKRKCPACVETTPLFVEAAKHLWERQLKHAQRERHRKSSSSSSASSYVSNGVLQFATINHGIGLPTVWEEYGVTPAYPTLLYYNGDTGLFYTIPHEFVMNNQFLALTKSLAVLALVNGDLVDANSSNGNATSGNATQADWLNASLAHAAASATRAQGASSYTPPVWPTQPSPSSPHPSTTAAVNEEGVGLHLNDRFTSPIVNATPASLVVVDDDINSNKNTYSSMATFAHTTF